MAKYNISHTCGHEVTIQLFGKHDERRRKIARLETEECKECAAAARASSPEAKGLTGSHKQVAWAADIRREQTAELEAYYSGVAARPAAPGKEDLWARVLTVLRSEIDAYLAEASASVWIDRRGAVDTQAMAKKAMSAAQA